MGAKRTFFWEKLPSEKLWYLVGIIASDGCLSPDGRHIDITAKDPNFLKIIQTGCGVQGAICKKYGSFFGKEGQKTFAYRIVIGSKSFYNFLIYINLTPRKSKIIDKLKIPNENFHDFLRGVIDGDGSICCWRHPTNGVEQWILKVSSGSENFLMWLQNKVEDLYGLVGVVHRSYNDSVHIIKFGKMAAQELLKICYSNASLALPRKLKRARQCIQTRRGWSRSKTVIKNKNTARVAEQADAQDSDFGSPL